MDIRDILERKMLGLFLYILTAILTGLSVFPLLSTCLRSISKFRTESQKILLIISAHVEGLVS